MYPHNHHSPTIDDRAIRTFDDRLSNDLENIDIALQGNPPRFERIWLKLSKRVLESRIPEIGGRL